MANVNVNKFFRYGSVSDLPITPTNWTNMAQGGFTGIGIVYKGDEIKGLYANGKHIDFSMIGGGNLTSVVNQNYGQFQLETPTTTDTINLKPDTGAYITISSAASTAGTGTHSGDITFGLTLASESGGTWSDGLMTNTTTNTMITERLAGLQSLTIYAGSGTTDSIGTYDPDSSSAQAINIPIFGNEGTTATAHVRGLVPATDNTTSAANYYLSGNGTWQQVTAAANDGKLKAYNNDSTPALVDVWSANSSNDTQLLGSINSSVYIGANFGVKVAATVPGGGAASSVIFGLTDETYTALGNANNSVQNVTASDGTVTVTKLTNGASGTTTFGVVQDTKVDTVSVVTNGTANLTTTATALGTGSYPTTPTKTDAYQGDNNAANYNPLSTKSYVDASIAAIPAADTYNLQATTATSNIASIDLYSNNGSTSTWAGGFGLRIDGSITLTSTGTQGQAGFGYSLGHSNSVTAVSTQGLLKIAYDAHGHITGSAAAQSSDIAGLFTDGGDASATVLTTAANTPTDAAPWTTSYTFNKTVEQNDLLIGTGSTSETIYVSKAVTATNPIVTKDDLSGIVGAMVYKGAVNSNSDLPTTGVQPGWTYVVATAGTYAGQACEVGDMIIAKDSTPNWNIISGENQVTNPGATVTADAANATTIATVDGTDITLKVASSADTVKTGDLEDLKLQKDSLTYSNGTWTEGTATDVVTYDTQAAVTQVEHSLGLVLNGSVVTYNPLNECTTASDPFAWESVTL